MGHQQWAGSSRRDLDPEAAKSVAAILQTLATPSRLRILAALESGPLTVGELIDAVEMEQSAVSHQLRRLRELGFVATERHGRQITYQLYDNHVAELIDQALGHAEHLRLAAANRAAAQ